ncbi:MAG TPA: LysR family transcriptional regulator [Steroidobacteraceae bacterium]
MTFDIRRLSHFIAAAEFGNINRAAESQHITQSALTRSIQVLEDELGAKLFERTPRGVTLTAIGKHLFDHARRIINAAAIAKSDMEALITGAGGEIRVGVAPPIATQGLMQLLFSLPRSLPMLSVSITEMFYDSLVQLLRSGELDLAISGIPETSDHSDLNVEPLARIPIRMRIVMRRDHPLASLKTITSEALQQANWVVTSQYHYLALLTRYFSERNMVPPKYRLYANTIGALVRAVLDADFIVLMSEELVERAFPPNSVVTLPPHWGLTGTRQVALLYTPNTIRSTAFLRLSQSLVDHFKSVQSAHAAESRPQKQKMGQAPPQVPLSPPHPEPLARLHIYK